MVALLLPGLSRAREQADAIKCLSNLRQLGQAMVAYSTNNRGFVIPSYKCFAALSRTGTAEPSLRAGD